MKKILLLLIIAILTSCGFSDFQEKANTQFADQHFKSAIAHIELYNIRYGHYPEILDSLTFLGDWDKAFFGSVDYQRLDTGYQLDVKAMISKTQPELKYPAEFWQGLGLRKSNILKTKDLQ